MQAYIYEWNGIDRGRVYVISQKICRATFGIDSCDRHLRDMLSKHQPFGYPGDPIAVSVAGVNRLRRPWQAYGLQASPLCSRGQEAEPIPVTAAAG